MEQTVLTTPGQTYRLSYSFSARPDTPLESNVLNVYVNDVLIATHTAVPSDFTTWRQFSTDVVATGTSTTLEFEGAGTEDSLGSLLDHVSLVACVESPSDLVVRGQDIVDTEGPRHRRQNS